MKICTQPAEPEKRFAVLLISLVLMVTILIPYLQVGSFDFAGYDDEPYVTENEIVQDGLTGKSIARAFSSTFAGNWHPLTWVSHLIDCHFFGLNPGMHHLTSLMFHMANSLLLLYILMRMTGSLWCSSLVAAFFALHPLHVESVAWIAERKDVLSTFFWMLCSLAYIRYIERPGTYRYLLVLFLFALGLMAKPMVITLPFVFLLLDFWPLGRFQLGQETPFQCTPDKSVSVLHLVWEKSPLFIMVVASGIITLAVQKSSGAVQSLDSLPLSTRIANAVISYMVYMEKTVWPVELAVFYPYPGAVNWGKASGAAFLLLSITLVTIKTIKRHPYLFVGWLWYLGTFVPVIGLVQVG